MKQHFPYFERVDADVDWITVDEDDNILAGGNTERRPGDHIRLKLDNTEISLRVLSVQHDARGSGQWAWTALEEKAYIERRRIHEKTVDARADQLATAYAVLIGLVLGIFLCMVAVILWAVMM